MSFYATTLLKDAVASRDTNWRCVCVPLVIQGEKLRAVCVPFLHYCCPGAQNTWLSAVSPMFSVGDTHTVSSCHVTPILTASFTPPNARQPSLLQFFFYSVGIQCSTWFALLYSTILWTCPNHRSLHSLIATWIGSQLSLLSHWNCALCPSTINQSISQWF